MDIIDGIRVVRVYWVRGGSPKGSEFRYEVKDPPCSGWMNAVVIDGEKRCTILCPYTLEAHTVRPGCGELKGSVEPPDGSLDRDRLVRLLTEKWNEMQSRGWIKDYDTVALVLRRLGAEVPAQMMRGGEEDTRKKGGKAVGVKLAKPVKRTSKRGKFLEWFLEGEGARSVREAMAEFGMTRSNALSYLYMIQKDHGIGYVLTGDTATVALPEGCDNPFDDETYELPEGLRGEPSDDAEDDWEPSKDEAPEEDDTAPEDDDDSWLD